MRIFNAIDLYVCCAGILVYLDPVISLAISKKMFRLYSGMHKMYLLNGISKDIYDTTIKLQDVPENYRRRIIFRLLMTDISNTKRYDKFKKGLRHSHMASHIYDTIEFVGLSVTYSVFHYHYCQFCYKGSFYQLYGGNVFTLFLIAHVNLKVANFCRISQ